MNTELFLIAVEMSFDAIVMGKINGVITYANDAASKMLGYSKEALIGKNVLDFVASEDQEVAIELSLKSIETLQGYLSSFTVIREDKAELLIEVTASVITDEKGNPVGFIDIIRSLEERKKAEEKIQENKNRYRDLFMNMPDGFAFCQMIFDQQGVPVDFIYLEINDAFECLTGLNRKEVVGKKVTVAIPGIKEANPELFEVYGRVSLTGASERFEIFFKPLSIWLDITVYSPKIGYFVAIFEDITRRKKLEEIFSKHFEGLELTVKDQNIKLDEAQKIILQNERFAAIGQLAGMVGHDLRDPLSGIKNAVYLLRKKQPNLTDSSFEILNLIDNSIEYSNKILNDLLDFSREIYLELEECSPKTVVDYVLLSFIIPRNIMIYDKTEFTPLFWVDLNKIERVFSNIIRNAIEAMTHGGILEISSQKKDEFIEFIFSDTGEGMSDETISKIFTPLFTTKAKGMGFGLPICKRIVETHGGNIEVSSVKGKGTVFKISLPIEKSIKGC